MRMTDYEWIDHGRRRERVLVDVMSKPRMPAEARDILNMKAGSKLSFTFRELLDRDLIRPKAKGLYGLTDCGQRLRRRLLRERGIAYNYSEPRLDWDTYVWIFVGRQRRVLLRVLDKHPRIAAELLQLAKKIHRILSRSDTYKVLKVFVDRNLSEVERHSRNKT